jgi:uncharacterized protein YsxB (DUF464 family)
MTKVCFYRDREGELTGFTARDHAGYAEEGSDIVCAAVSALVIHTVNAIEQFTDDAYEGQQDEQHTEIRFRIKGKPGEQAELFLRALEATLTDMQSNKSYKDFIEVKYSEV